MKEKYVYYCLRRQAAPGTIPTKNLLKIENFPERMQFAFCKAWSRVTYSEPLTPETLRQYELAENKPEEDSYIQLEKVDTLIFFKGTETEQAKEEEKERRNEKKLQTLYNSIIAGTIQALYIKQGKHGNGMELYYILHPSAKYECLQCTAVMFKDNDFLYMCGDHKTPDFDDFLKESAFYGMDGKKVYYF